MSKNIVVPGKPNWRIVVDVDDKGRMTISVKDQIVIPGKMVQRQMNQIELAALLTNTVSSILQNTLEITRRSMRSAEENKANDH